MKIYHIYFEDYPEEYQKNERYQGIMKKAIKNYKKDMERFGW